MIANALRNITGIFERQLDIRHPGKVLFQTHQARIRVQLSAAHTDDDVDRAVAAFVAARDAVAAVGAGG